MYLLFVGHFTCYEVSLVVGAIAHAVEVEVVQYLSEILFFELRLIFVGIMVLGLGLSRKQAKKGEIINLLTC